MDSDKILLIEIDQDDKLNIKPDSTTYSMIYRSAAEVHWDENRKTLYSPKPREWRYFDWYCHITSLIKIDCSCKLYITNETEWINIPPDLKVKIREHERNESTTSPIPPW